MDRQVQHLPDYRLVVERVRGELTMGALRGVCHARIADARVRGARRVVTDARDVRIRSYDVGELRDLIHEVNDRDGDKDRTRWALLLEEPRMVALSMFARIHLEESSPVGIFATPEAAAQWLDVPEDVIDGEGRQV